MSVTCLRKVLALATTILVLVACTANSPTTGGDRPAVVPHGWIADFDYQSGIKRYLRQQYDSARLEGKTAYIYLYSDAGTRCKIIRRAMNRERIAPLLREVRVTMLDFWRLQELYKTSPGIAFDPGNASATFVKISMEGNLTDAMFHVGVFMYRPELYYEGGDPDSDRPTFEQFAEELERFFARNAEI